MITSKKINDIMVLVLDYAENGTLRDLMKNNPNLKNQLLEIIKVFRQIVLNVQKNTMLKFINNVE